MTTQLPRRPFGTLAPPADGLDVVRREARRRRRRKVTVVAAGGTGVAAVAVAVVLSTAAGGLAVLKPMPPADGGASTAPTPSGASAPAAGRHLHRSSRQPVRGDLPVGPGSTQPGGAGATGGAASTTRSGDNTTPAGQVPAPGRAEPVLTRYRSTNPGPSVRSATLCGEGVSYSDGADASVGWCFGVSATHEAGAERLTVHLCRDNTTGGKLTFPSSREVDLAVRDGGKTIWDWGLAHPDHPGAHQLTAPVNGCWNWTLLWSGNTQRGGVAPHGTYTFVATTMAKELGAYDPRSLRFTY